eukprot:scaffold11206_cov74-Phaeocystis_antarctica.AAC.1
MRGGAAIAASRAPSPDAEVTPSPPGATAARIHNGWRGVGRGVGTAPIKLPSIAKIQETLLRVLPFFSDDIYGRPRLGTGSCVSVRQTTSLVVRGLGRAFLCLSVCLSAKVGAWL